MIDCWDYECKAWCYVLWEGPFGLPFRLTSSPSTRSGNWSWISHSCRYWPFALTTNKLRNAALPVRLPPHPIIVLLLLSIFTLCSIVKAYSPVYISLHYRPPCNAMSTFFYSGVAATISDTAVCCHDYVPSPWYRLQIQLIHYFLALFICTVFIEHHLACPFAFIRPFTAFSVTATASTCGYMQSLSFFLQPQERWISPLPANIRNSYLSS